MRSVRKNLTGLSIGVAFAIAACATAAPRMATVHPLASTVDRLSVDISTLHLTPLKAHRIDPSLGLDPTDIAVLAVLNSPDLVAKRSEARIAEAQSFAAGLLPDPQIVLSADFPVHPVPGVTTAYSAGPTLDLIGLLTHSATVRAARGSSRQADLELLWAEWGAAQQARVLATSILAGEAKSGLLEQLLAQLDARVAETRRAQARGDLSEATDAADQANRLDVRAELDTAHHEAERMRGELNALIGLAPDVRLPLVEQRQAHSPQLDINKALVSLADRRPDLLALKAGLDAQDANVRRSILARFPMVNLGFSHQRDNSAIISNGPAATLTLPIFNRGRGEIAVQRATRDSLAAEYQARLDQTIADVASARRDREAAQTALDHLRAQVPVLSDAAARAHEAESRRDLDSAALLALDQAALRARLSVLDEMLAVSLADIGLATVLFLPVDESEPS